MKDKVCYVSMYYDINRANWNSIFKRDFNDYLDCFSPFISLFEAEKCGGDCMIVYIDERHHDQLFELLKPTTQIKLISINETFLKENISIWSRLETEREIMNDASLRKITFDRNHCPECFCPEYTIINHCKVDFVQDAILRSSEYDYFCWADFGYFKLAENIPDKLLDINNFNLNTINYCLINPLDALDKDIEYTLKYAPERIAGSQFFGRRDMLLKFTQLYKEILDAFYSLRIVDDDQHIVLQTYFKYPDNFTLHLTGWHRMFKLYSK